MPSPAGSKERSSAAGLAGTTAGSQGCLEVCFGAVCLYPPETPLWRPPTALARHLGRHSGQHCLGLHLSVAGGLMTELREVFLMPGRPVLLC